MISQQSFGSSGLPFLSAKAKKAPLEHTTLPAVALFSSQFLSMLSRSDACDSGQCAGPTRRLSRRQKRSKGRIDTDVLPAYNRAGQTFVLLSRTAKGAWSPEVPLSLLL
jgi:hypothetical protein